MGLDSDLLGTGGPTVTQPGDDDDSNRLIPKPVDLSSKDWSSAYTSDWDYVVDVVKETWGFGAEREFKAQVNAAARRYQSDFGSPPNATELLGYGRFSLYMNNLYNRTDQLPKFFAVDGQSYWNDPYEGPTWMRMPSPASAANPAKTSPTT